MHVCEYTKSVLLLLLYSFFFAWSSYGQEGTNSIDPHAGRDCVKVTPNNKCPPGWYTFMQKPQPPICLRRELFKHQNFSDRRKYCHSLGGETDVLFPLTQQVDRDFFNLTARRWWIGKNYEPSKDEDKNCAFLKYGQNWTSKPCSVKSSFVCVRQWVGGPADTRLEIEYHRPDKVVYEDVTMRAICTAITHPALLHWTFSIGDKIQTVTQTELQTSVERLTSIEGFCITRVRQVFTVKYDRVMENAWLACFTYEVKTNSKCVVNSTAVKLCDTKSFSVYSGPKGAPDLEVKYEGYSKVEEEVEEGRVLIARCTVNTAVNGTLQWMISLKNVSFVLEDTDHRVLSNVRNDNNDTVISVLKWKLRVADSGTIIACFAYDAAKFHKTACDDQDRFCSKTKMIKVYLPNTNIYRIYIIGAAIFAAILGLMCICTFVGLRNPKL